MKKPICLISPSFFFLLNKIPQIEFVEHFSTAVSEIMKQIKINIARSRLPERRLKLADRNLSRVLQPIHAAFFVAIVNDSRGIPFNKRLPG